jgi:hypothetical protein
LAFTIGTSLVSDKFAGTITAAINSFLIFGGYIGQVSFGVVVSSKEFAHLFKVFSSQYKFHLVDTQYQTAMNLYPLATFIAVLASLYIVGMYIIKSRRC